MNCGRWTAGKYPQSHKRVRDGAATMFLPVVLSKLLR